ncbi:hypothetical protein DFH94DRAFT_760304 [Russula ochroleuca]|uniref:Uncharacterized protein n=1 Tax=Russula ochroleuca TaxID=152965 RepID=A0A9P5K1V5_9AGAM|nr:hypothetical protein DFH94DRAFT_760304 [Russula ochroleuca]
MRQACPSSSCAPIQTLFMITITSSTQLLYGADIGYQYGQGKGGVGSRHRWGHGVTAHSLRQAYSRLILPIAATDNARCLAPVCAARPLRALAAPRTTPRGVRQRGCTNTSTRPYFHSCTCQTLSIVTESSFPRGGLGQYHGPTRRLRCESVGRGVGARVPVRV